MGCKFGIIFLACRLYGPENYYDEVDIFAYLIVCVLCVGCSQDIGSSTSVCGPTTRGVQAREKGEVCRGNLMLPP